RRDEERSEHEASGIDVGCAHRGRAPDRARDRLLGRAGRLAPVVHPRSRSRIRPPPRQARAGLVHRRRRAAHLRLVPDGRREEAEAGAAAEVLCRVILASPISYVQALILGLLQGVTELFPISSLGHSVILPQLLGWDIHQNDDYFITFLV